MHRNPVAETLPTEIWIYIMALLENQTPCVHRVTPAFDGPCPVNISGRPPCPNGWTGRGLAFELTVTCRYFWNIGQVSLYRVLHWSRRGYAAKMHQLIEHRELRRHVQVIHLDPGRVPYSLKILLPDPTPLCIFGMESLRELALTNMPITLDIIRGLLAASGLEKLQIMFPDQRPCFAEGVPANWSKGRFGPKLHSLLLDELPDDSASVSKWAQLFSTSLRRLDLSGDDIQAVIHAAHREAISLTDISTLVIRHRRPDHGEPSSDSVIYKLVSLCSQLENIWINTWEGLTLIPAPKDGPSKLRFIGGGHMTRELLEQALSLPSLESIHFASLEDPVDRDTGGRTEASYVRQLVVEGMRWTAGDLDYIASIAPNVERLEVRGDDDRCRVEAPGGSWFPVRPDYLHAVSIKPSDLM